jgi:hypothetical protein
MNSYCSCYLSFRKLQNTFQEEAAKMQAFQEKIGKLRVPAAKLMAQVNENQMVKTVRDAFL